MNEVNGTNLTFVSNLIKTHRCLDLMNDDILILASSPNTTKTILFGKTDSEHLF